MFFSPKTKGFFVEVNSHSTLVARTSASAGPLVVEELKSCPTADVSALEGILRELQPKRSGQHNYVKATCGVYPPSRLVRQATLDPKRYKDNGYADEVLTTQMRIESSKYLLALLNAGDGTDFNFEVPSKKEAVFAGMLHADIADLQTTLLQRGLYPERLELGSLSVLGAIVDYHVFGALTAPTLVLEVDTDSTQSFIVNSTGLEASRPLPQGLDAMIPIVQKELGLKDEESARKLFYSNAFDFTGMGATLIKKLLKELQSSIGFYEVQTGQSIGQVMCTLLPPKLGWLETAVSTQLGVPVLNINYAPWLSSKGVTLSASITNDQLSNSWLGVLSLMLQHNHAPVSETTS